MRVLLLLLMFLFTKVHIHAQENKRNNSWVLGHVPAVVFSFNSSLNIQNSFQQINGIKSGSSISDSNGNLLIYSTGFYIGNSSGFTIDNGAKVNSPYGNVLSDHVGGMSPYEQTSIILPKKGNQYYVFSTGMSDSAAINCQQQIKCIFDVLNYSVVDMDSNAGNGKVVEKNVVLYDKQEYTNMTLTAVRHGNGKDWWLVKADCNHDQFHLFHVSADTIIGPYKYQIADTADWCNIFSQIYFSPDGAKMVSSIYSQGGAPVNDWTEYNLVDVYDFNRCTGVLNKPKRYTIPSDTVSYPYYDDKRGVCFSPDSKLLYVSTYYGIYQIDLSDTNRYNNLFIHGPDTSIADFPGYSTMACGPDGRLYIGNYNGTRQYMSYIEYPNVKGLGCNFVPQGLWQPYTNLLTPPNMPNYGLGVDTANGCWPLSLPNPPKEGDEMLVVYPNPASTSFTISCEALKGKRIQVILFNMLGQEVLSNECHFAQQKSSIDVSSIPSGVYLMKVGEWVRRVVVE